MNNTMSNNLHMDLLNFLKDVEKAEVFVEKDFKKRAKEVFEKFYESEMKFDENDEAEYLKEKNTALEKNDIEMLNEIKEFEEFRSNIVWICKNIENVDFQDDTVKARFESVYVFLKKMNSGLDELNETMKELNNSLKNAAELLTTYVNNNLDGQNTNTKELISN